MSSSTPLDGGQFEGRSLPPDPIRSRREAAARTRRRRLLVGDLLLAAALCVVGVIVAPGLAIVAIGALLVLLACGVSALHVRRRGQRMQRELQELRNARLAQQGVLGRDGAAEGATAGSLLRAKSLWRSWSLSLQRLSRRIRR